MFRSRFPSKLPTDVSNNGSLDPNSIKKPIVENTLNKKSEPFITKIEKTVEQVDAPVLVTEYKFTVQTKVEPPNPPHAQTRFSFSQPRRTSPPMESNPVHDHKVNAPTKVEQEKDYGVVNNTLDKPTKSPVRDNGSNPEVDKRFTAVPDPKYGPPKKMGTQPNYGVINNKQDSKQDSPPIPIRNQTYGSPSKSYGFINEKRDKPTTQVRDNGYNSSPIQERPKEVGEYITQVQTEASRPTRPNLLSGNNWHGIGGSNGYGEYTNNYGNQNLDNPIIDQVKYDRVVVQKNGWEGPKKKEWPMPSTQATQIYGPTNDIGEALRILKEAAKSAPNPQDIYSYEEPRVSTRDTYMGHIDSKEAQRRHGNPNLRPHQYSQYVGTINSAEAVRKYRGAPV